MSIYTKYCTDPPVTYDSLAWHLTKACDAAGIPRTSWHPLRHTFATDLCARGAPLKVIQDLLGHQKIEMTERYIHPVTEMMRAAIHLLEPGMPVVWAAGGQQICSTVAEPLRDNTITQPILR